MTDTTATSLAKEEAEQQSWRLHPHCRGIDRFGHLLRNEFLSPDQQNDLQCQALRTMITHAVEQVPYYGALFAKHELTAADIDQAGDLPRLAILKKSDLRQFTAELTARSLPAGQEPGSVTQTSGTTGRPVKVRQTRHSLGMNNYLKQRELRWFRFNPLGNLAMIRLPGQLPLTPERRPLSLDQTLNLPNWPGVGKFFQTGPARCFSVFNQIDRQAEWLDQHRPQFLISYPDNFEHLTFAYQSRHHPDYTRGVLATSGQITLGMDRRITATFGTQLNHNYSLNEFGIIASRCREGDRYHVHSEHCLVEIVDQEGYPCHPGETGRILVTTLSNHAMPLIRYDTGDFAVATAGPCPCGRTLPTFGVVLGRHSHSAFLPENTLPRVGALRQAIEVMDPELIANLRKFQIHQFRDQSFELRLVAPGGLPQAFTSRIHSAWQDALAGAAWPLRLIELNYIPRGPGGKFMDFTSDFYPPANFDA